MDASIGFLLCCLVGIALGYNVQRDLGYNYVPNNVYSGSNQNFIPEQSQRLFWGGQGSNQVGGTGFWAHLTNKFPFLGNMFGRMELPSQYGAPSQFNVPTQYGPPAQLQAQYPAQLYRSQQFGPTARDVALTDDAVIVTPPFVPIAPQPAPVPAPVPAPAPAPGPAPGYQYNKPQYRLELPQK